MISAEDEAHARAQPSGLSAAASSATAAPTAAAGSRPASAASAAARTSREPTMTPSAPRGRGGAACSGVEMPKPSATGTSVWARTRASNAGEPVGHAGALAGRAGDRDRVDEAARPRADRGEALVGRGRRDERDEREPGGVAGRQRSPPASSSGRSGTIRPRIPRVGELGGEALERRARGSGSRST